MPKFILYLHTMETFIYPNLKKASREKDISKIMTLGPYALVLSFILDSASNKPYSKLNEIRYGISF